MIALIAFLLRPFVAWRERRYAKNAARSALYLYHRLLEQEPSLSGMDLYTAFVRTRNGVPTSEARAVLRCAKESFATWPFDRELTFRDLVQYLVISEHLQTQPKRASATINMAYIVAKIIPKTY